MAVLDVYVDPNLEKGDRQHPNLAGGSRALITVQSFEIAAADDDGSVYRIGRIASNALLLDCKIACSAITGGTDFDLGLYHINKGDAVDADLFMSGQSFAVASRVIDGLSAVDVKDANKRIWELLGLPKDPMIQYDLAITANTVGSADGEVSIKLLTSQH